MSRLTPDEINEMRTLAARPLPDKDQQIVARLADYIRMDLPDLDDVTIGRAVLAMCDHLGLIAIVTPGVQATALLGLAVSVGMDLTAIDWQEAPR